MLFEQGKHQEAADAYRRLVAQDPRTPTLRTSLAGALGALGRYDEAMKELDAAVAIEPLNVEAYHNRGAVFERRDDPQAAIEEYRRAVRYNPQYEPSRRALQRLTGSGGRERRRATRPRRQAIRARAAGQPGRAARRLRRAR